MANKRSPKKRRPAPKTGLGNSKIPGLETRIWREGWGTDLGSPVAGFGLGMGF